MSRQAEESPVTSFHANLISALQSSSALHPLHVEVHNDSVWYHKRHKLGPRRHGLIIVKYNNSNLKYEGFIYDMKRRQEDLEVVPQRVLVSTANSKWLAFKQAEIALRERDRFRPIIDDDLVFNNGQVNKNPDGAFFDTHFRIVVVSECFYRMTSLDRLALVYRELSHSIVGHRCANDQLSPYKCLPARMKLTSTFGENVSNWEIFWFVLNSSTFKTELNINCLTPAQWRPEIYKPLISERLGKTHKDLQALQVSTIAKSNSQKVRLRKLTTEVAPKYNTHETTFQRTGTGSEGDSRLQHSRSEPIIPPSSAPNNEIQDASLAPSQDESKEDDSIGKEFMEEVEEAVDTRTSSSKNGKKKKVNMGDTLGLDASVSGVTYSKLGGIYGHFFNDLSDDVRTLVLERYKNNKELIRAFPIGGKEREEAEMKLKKDEDTFKPRTNLSRMRKKIHDKANLGEEDHGTASQAEMRDDVLISNRKIELIAVRLQRIRRMHQLYRARRQWWRREYAVLAIQRIVRGRYARQFTDIYRRLQPIAATRIQRFYRSFRVKKVLVTWWYLSRRLTRFVLPKIKRFIRNCFLWWISKRQASAVVIQKYVRRRLAYIKRLKYLAIRYLYRTVFPPAATHIQRIVRGHFGRLRFQRIQTAMLILMVDVPAALRIQRIFRGRRAKKILQRLKYEHKMLLRLQKWVRETVRRIWDRELIEAQRIKTAAVAIQRIYRGHYDRMIYRLKHHKRWYKQVYLPAVLKVQCKIRQYIACRIVADKLRHTRAARVIQRSFRYHVRYERTKVQRRELMRLRVARRVVVIQKHVRRFLARKAFLQKLLAYRGRVVLAAKVIMRAWRTYKMEQTYSFLMEETRKENEKKLYDKLVEVIHGVKIDVREAYIDLDTTMKSRDRYKERAKQLDQYITQAALRMENIKREMTKLTMEDFERGWAEALGQEYEYVIHQEMMAKEEIRVIRAKMRQLQEEILTLQLEIEESEMELDEMDQRCIELINQMRLRLIREQERKADKNMRRLLYRERSHWRIRSNRVNKMLAARSSYHRLIQEAKDRRSLGYATTVSYEKRERLRDYERADIAVALELEARNRAENAKPKTCVTITLFSMLSALANIITGCLCVGTRCMHSPFSARSTTPYTRTCRFYADSTWTNARRR